MNNCRTRPSYKSKKMLTLVELKTIFLPLVGKMPPFARQWSHKTAFCRNLILYKNHLLLHTQSMLGMYLGNHFITFQCCLPISHSNYYNTFPAIYSASLSPCSDNNETITTMIASNGLNYLHTVYVPMDITCGD
jgi:hypothetical protein